MNKWIWQINTFKKNTLSLQQTKQKDNIEPYAIESSQIVNGQFTNGCSSISECDSLKRISVALKFYSAVINDNNLDDTTCSRLEDYFFNYRCLLDDYFHLLITHIDNDPDGSQFQAINDYLQKMVPSCKVKNCKKYLRNSRDREMEEININDSDNKYEMSKHYIEIMDTIHVNFIHSYDIGFRVNKNLLFQQAKEERKQTENEFDFNVDDTQMNNLVKIISKKQKELSSIRGRERIKKNKFMTNFEASTPTKRSLVNFICFLLICVDIINI